MKKSILIIIAVLVITGLSSLFLKYPFNVSGDPFRASPGGVSPNCGPEDRYKFNVAINSKNDFVDFLKIHEIDQWVRLDNFKKIEQSEDLLTARANLESAEVDWSRVLSEVTTESVGQRTVYVLKYNPYTCSGFTLKMTDDGYVSVYGCCGV